MNKYRTRFKAPTDGLVQMDILSGIKNMKRMRDQKLTAGSITITPISSTDENEKDNLESNIERRELAFPILLSDDEDDDDNRNTSVADKSSKVTKQNQNLNKEENSSSVSNTSNIHNNSVTNSITILQNVSTSSGDPTKSNSDNAVSSKVKRTISKNKENISIRNNTPSEKNLTSGTNTTLETPSTSTQSPKKEEKQINPNFLKVMNELVSGVLQSTNLSSILSETEINILKAVTSSRQEYQYACYKLYMLSWKWQNLFIFCEKINCHLSDEDIIELFKLMKQNDIIDTDWIKEDVTTLLNILSYQRVQEICSNLGILGKTKKDMITNLLQYCNNQKTLPFCKPSKEIVLEKILKKLGKYVIKIKDAYKNAFYSVYLLGTFTNPKFQDKKQYFRIIQESDYPDYTVQDHIVFYTRADFESYAKACSFRESLESLTVSKGYEDMNQMGNEIINILKKMQPHDKEDDRFKEVPHLKRFTAVEVYKKILTNICSTLKAKYFNNVHYWLKYLINNFPKSRHLGDWYYDLSTLTTTHLKKPEDAANIIIEAFKVNKKYLTEIQIQNLGEKGKQLKKMRGISQLKHDVLAELLPVLVDLDDFPQVTTEATAIRENVPGKKRHYLVQNSDGSKEYSYVEQVALDYYERCGYPSGEHCEGSIILATFTLFFWDIIYNPDIVVPGTFLSRYQECPLDMYTTYFYVNRKELIDKRLSDLAKNWSDEQTDDFVTENWINYSHKAGLVDVSKCIPNKERLNVIVRCVGRKILSDIYRRLVKDLRQYRSGMPDLLVWNEQDKKAKFVEVKGENDTLSAKQKLWLKYLKSIGANIEVCQVHSIGSKKKSKAKMKQPINNDEPADKNNVCSSKCITSTPRKKRCDSEDSISHFVTPPSSPIPQKSSTIKKQNNNVTSSSKKRKTVVPKSLEDSYKKTKLSVTVSSGLN